MEKKKKRKKTKIEGNNTQVHTDSESSLFHSLSMDRYGQGNVLVVSGFVTDRPSLAISGDTRLASIYCYFYLRVNTSKTGKT